MHEFIQDGCVDVAVVRVVVDVAFQLIGRLQARIVTVESTLDRVAHQERDTAGAMVGTGAVVLDSPSELGEHPDHGVIRLAKLVQIRPETLHCLRHLVPQLGVVDQFIGVRIEAAVLGVEDACPKVC